MPRKRFHPDDTESDNDSYTDSSESDSYRSGSSAGSRTVCMQCMSCKGKYVRRDSSFCKECYEVASKVAEQYKQEIEDLKAKNFFLRLGIQTDDNDPAGRTDGPGFADVALVAVKECPNGGQPKPVLAHRAILASRSPVFKAMFKNEMEKRQISTVKISEVSHDAVRAFVNYLYSAEACLDEQMARELLVLAEKYQVKHLKAYCEKLLVSKLNWDNSIMRYAFAHQHNAKHLLEAALSLIIDNIDKLKNRQEYSELIEKDPRLVVEIYEACLAKKENTAAPKNTPAAAKNTSTKS